MDQRWQVFKFGGTSVGSVGNMRKVANLVQDGNKKIVVLSAMSGTTNALVSIANKLLVGESVLEEIKALRAQYDVVVDSLLDTNAEKGRQVVSQVFDQLNQLASNSFDAAHEKIVLSQGEQLSTQLFQLYLEETGVKSVLLSALDFMRTDSVGEPIEEIIQERIAPLLINADSDLIITQGFISRNPQGEIDNLKRGGSDYTASLIGAAVDAASIQIWTDIDGLHNNDPRVVDGTSAIPQISFDEAAELAYFGAKILHPYSIVPARKKNIPVWLKNTMKPEAPGTLIDSHVEDKGIKAVAAKDGITAIKIKSSRMLLAYGFLRRVFEVFEKYRTPIDMITTSEIAVSLTIDDDKHIGEIMRELTEFGEVQIDRDQCIVCVVGNFIAEQAGLIYKVFDAVKEVPIRMISYGGSKHNVSLLVHSNDKAPVLKMLNQELF